MPEFCPGYAFGPFKALAEDFPGESVYAKDDFRIEWGPIFHRERLDGSARVLVIGQDPGQHENILRRIFVGEAGRRVQGFLAKLGISRSYVLLNALLYSVYGGHGAKYVTRDEVAEYRNRWIDAVLASGRIEAVVTFGTMAAKAWDEYVEVNGSSVGIAVSHLTHPTYPESAGGTKAERAEHTKQMLTQWNSALELLHPAIAHKDDFETPLVVYGEAFVDSDKVDIPSRDLPPGAPPWMYDDDGWAHRGLPRPHAKPLTDAEALHEKRVTIVVTVPKTVLPEPEE